MRRLIQNLGILVAAIAGVFWLVPTFTSSAAPPTVKTQTATVTTGSSSFFAERVFDLGQMGVFRLTATLVSSVSDGETFGSASGDIAFDTEYVNGSVDGVTRLGASDLSRWIVDDPGNSDVFDRYGVTPRYVMVRVRIIHMPSFDLYTGTHHPTVTVRLDLSATT